MTQATTLTAPASQATAAGQVRTTGLIKIIGIMIMAAGLDRAVHHVGIAGLGEVVGLDKAAAHVSLHPYYYYYIHSVLKNHIFKESYYVI